MGCGICCTELQSNKSNAALGGVSFAPSPACERGLGRGHTASRLLPPPPGRGGERKKRVLEWSGGSPALASRRLYLRDPARDERRSVNPPLPPRIHPRPVPVREAR